MVYLRIGLQYLKKLVLVSVCIFALERLPLPLQQEQEIQDRDDRRIGSETTIKLILVGWSR